MGPLTEAFIERKHRLMAELEMLRAKANAIQKMAADMAANLDAMVPDPDEQWLTASKAASMLGISPKTVSNYCGIGVFKRAKKVGSDWRIHVDDIDDFVRNRRFGGSR